jgi:hypothetical protein
MISREVLVGHWVHSHEEDSGDLRVFRPKSFEFPPSRGREELELKADGRSVVHSPGPVDVPEEAAGTWELEGETLRLAAGGAERSMRVVAAEPERLVVSAQ